MGIRTQRGEKVIHKGGVGHRGCQSPSRVWKVARCGVPEPKRGEEGIPVGGGWQWWETVYR